MLASNSLTTADRGLLILALALLALCMVLAAVASFGLLPGWGPLLLLALILFASTAEAIADGAVGFANVHPHQYSWETWSSLAILAVTGGALLRWRTRFGTIEGRSAPITVVLLALSTGQVLLAAVVFSQVLSLLN